MPAHLCCRERRSGNAVSFLAPLVESGRRTADLWPPLEEKTQSTFACRHLFIWKPSGNLVLPHRLLNGTGKADFRTKMSTRASTLALSPRLIVRANRYQSATSTLSLVDLLQSCKDDDCFYFCPVNSPVRRIQVQISRRRALPRTETRAEDVHLSPNI